MPRSPRITEPGVANHVLNRRVMRMTLFEKDRDYEAFERVLAASLNRPDAPPIPPTPRKGSEFCDLYNGLSSVIGLVDDAGGLVGRCT